MFRFYFLVACFAFLFVSCDSSSDSVDVKKPYGEMSINAAHRIAYSGNYGSYQKPFVGRVVGQKDVNGTIYERYLLTGLNELGYVESETEGTELWVKPYPLGSDGKMTVSGIDDQVTITGTFDPPLTINIEVPENEKQDFETVYTGTVPEFEGIKTVNIAGSYTVKSKDTVVETAMGNISGVIHIGLNGTLTGDSLPAIVKNIPLEGEAWVHEDLGLIKARIPQLGIEGNVEETWDIDDPDSEYRTIKKTGLVSDSRTSWALSTNDFGDFNADKNTHAKMLLEVRWADEELAKSDQRVDTHPAVRINFSTVWGVFFYQMTESPVSIFHPEDNGKGYKFYYAYVDEAAKNEPGENGILYKITVETTDPSVTPDIKVTGRIYYRSLR